MSHTIYFDFETAGLEPKNPSIQLAAIAQDDGTGEECASMELKLKFNVSDANPEALAMNHYSKEAWKDAVYPVDAARRLSRFIEPYRSIEMVSKTKGTPYSVAKLAGYNALTFDLPRLRQLYDGQFFPFSYHVRDILQRVLFYFDEHPQESKPASLKLPVICEHFGICVDGAHDALADARMSAALLRRLRCSQ